MEGSRETTTSGKGSMEFVSVMHCMYHIGNCHALYVPYGKLSWIVYTI